VWAVATAMDDSTDTPTNSKLTILNNQVENCECGMKSFVCCCGVCLCVCG
jgi:hypothetical protein